MNFRYILVLAVVTGIFHGCGTGLLSGKVGEGVIEYALTFPEYDPNGIMAGMLPERTTVSFNEDQQVAELSAGMGMFRTVMVANNTSEAMEYHLSLMSKKIVAHMVPSDLSMFQVENGMPTILYTNDIDTVAGYPCKRAVAIFDGIDHPEIELWYTDRIAMKNPNWFGPFAAVPGVLLRYELVQNGVRMRLNAISVQPGKVDPAKFEVKKEFEKVPAQVLEHELAEVLGTFTM
ncbi:MAG: hypothetical protein ABI432_03250 [Flavobacteriales bacterium]